MVSEEVSIILVLLCWPCSSFATTPESDSVVSTTQAYVTRPPLILLTPGTNTSSNRNQSLSHNRRILLAIGAASGSTAVSSVPTTTVATTVDITSSVATTSAATTPASTINTTIEVTTTRTTTVPSTHTTAQITHTDVTSTVASTTAVKVPTVSNNAVEKKASVEKNRPVENTEDLSFQAALSGASPSTSVQVSFRKSSKYSRYYINCTDIDEAESTGHLVNTYDVDNIPYTISGLLPGHLYVLQLIGGPSRKSASASADGLVNVARTFIVTQPEPPRIDPQNITVTTNSISILAEKAIGALQDYFLLTYWESGSSKSSTSPSTWNINVTDIREQKTVEFYVGKLKAGAVYNVSVASFRRGSWSKKWNAVVITKPVAPTNVRVVSSDANEIVLAWDGPANSGVDSYYVAYRSESHPNATEVDTRDLGLKLDNGIIPGEKYFVDIYAVKGGDSFSEPVYLEIDTKPLPPTSSLVQPNYSMKLFEAIAYLQSSRSSRQDSCVLQYTAEDESPSSVTNATAVAKDDQCRWFLPLTPAKTYRFVIWTSRGALAVSDPYSNSSMIEPAFDADLLGVTMLPGERTLEVKWNKEALLEYWPTLVGKNGNLSGALMSSYQLTKTVNPLVSTGGIVFDGLTPGACYTTQVYASVAATVSRNRTQYRVRLDPSAVSVTLANASANTAVISFKTESPPWTLDSSCRLVISVKDDADHTVLNKTMPTGQTTNGNAARNGGPNDWALFIYVTNLKAFSRYQVDGIHVCGNDADECDTKRRTLESMKFGTAQGVPGSVGNVRMDVQTPSVAMVMWDPPEQTNGMLTGYLIAVYPDTFTGEDPWNITVPSNFHSFSIQNLTGGFKYAMDVRAQTMAGLGPSSTADTTAKELPSVKTLVWAPPKPYGRPEPLYNTIRSNDFSLRFNLSMFSTRNGLLEGYSVIVAEGESGGFARNNSVGTWFDVQLLDVWPPYVAVMKPLPRAKNLDSTSVTEVIGVDMDCPKINHKSAHGSPMSPNTVTQFCNGPLRPGRKYRVKLRVYTASNLFSDSDYSDVVITNVETGTASGTVVAIILALLVILASLVGIFIFLRGRGKNPLRICAQAKNRLLSSRSDTVDCGSSTVEAVSSGGGAVRRQRSLRERAGVDGRLDKLNSNGVHHHVYMQLPTVLASANTDVSRPVLKCNFADHVRLMSADSDFRFSEEFEELKQVGRSEPCTAADVPCNRNKNRFTNILPYDHSRVKLVPVDDEEGSDYINASYIPGYNSPREYIAAQGPLPSTRDDFWRMIWEQNCPAIVNLTRCIEKGREKCDQYWPGDTDPVYYGDVEVLLMNETRFPDWTVREFKVSRCDQSRTIRHFHFTAWPDFGVPERPQTLVKFVRAFRARVPAPDACGPIVVHCSAGVGRSGTLIAIDRLTQHSELHEYVDVYGVVLDMRKERAWMVQTEQQYIFIHQCVLCILEGRENDDEHMQKNYPPRPMAPAIEIHQNPAFEDDEGIAESGV